MFLKELPIMNSIGLQMVNEVINYDNGTTPYCAIVKSQINLIDNVFKKLKEMI